MTGKLGYLTMILLAIGLAAFAFDRIVPLTTAQAREALRLEAAGPEEARLEEGQAHSPSPSPVILVATGLLAILIGLLAFFPLLVDDPALLKNAGVLLKSPGNPPENGGA